jgi:ribose 5-phosphate isomerase A
MTNSELALEHIPDGGTLGLGTGRAAEAFIRALAERVRSGLRVRGVPTSEATASLAGSLGIPLVALDEVEWIDVDVDGADEVDDDLHLIKGYGGALLREKMVAAASRKVIILVSSEKLVPTLGSRGRLPVEVVPFGRRWCARQLERMGFQSAVREVGGRPFVTDNGNLILDCAVRSIGDPADLDRELREIPGVVATGLFVRGADLVLVEEESRVRVLERKPR